MFNCLSDVFRCSFIRAGVGIRFTKKRFNEIFVGINHIIEIEFRWKSL